VIVEKERGPCKIKRSPLLFDDHEMSTLRHWFQRLLTVKHQQWKPTDP
jgi:hypothetical protein